MRLTKLAPALTLLGLVAATSSLLGGCVDNRATLYIDHVAAFSSEDDSCELDASLEGLQLGSGSYDQFAGNPYFITVVVGNQLAPLGDNDTLRPETSRIQIQGAVISVTAPQGGTSVDAFTVPFAGIVHPDDSEDPGLAAMRFPILPASPLLDPGNYLVSIVIFGETLAGTDVETGEFVFPVDVLEYGSLSSCSSYSTLLDEGRINPCGGSQDGYVVPCGNRTDGVRCGSCN